MLKALSYVSKAGVPLIGKTIGQCFKETVAANPNKLAAHFAHEQKTWNYTEFLQRAEDLAAGFVELGLPKQARIGVYAQNCSDWLLTQYAAKLGGFILVNINPSYQAFELDHALQTVDISALVLSTTNMRVDSNKLINDLIPELSTSKGSVQSSRYPSLRHVIKINPGEQAGMLQLSELSGKSQTEYRVREKEIRFDDPVNIMFTAGTTGKPKAATLTHHGMVNNSLMMIRNLKMTPNDIVTIPVPLFHVFGTAGNLVCTISGAGMNFPDYSFNPVKTLETIESQRSTGIYGVPTMYMAYLAAQAKVNKDLSSLRYGVSAGSIFSPELIKKVNSQLHIKDIANIYAMTETSPAMFMLPLGNTFELMSTTAGSVVDNIESKLVDKQGDIVPRDHIGEICVRGYSVMQGYWNNEEANRKAFDAARWFHTGDLGILDEAGYIRIVGRTNDMIIRGGENIYPSEIEDFLLTHPSIAEAFVIGIPHEYYGEEVCAWIKMKPNTQHLTLEDIKAFCKGQISHAKIPTAFKLVESFPCNEAGKVLKNKMKAEYSS
jgi:fatty-acyl-CoA synthase